MVPSSRKVYRMLKIGRMMAIVVSDIRRLEKSSSGNRSDWKDPPDRKKQPNQQPLAPIDSVEIGYCWWSKERCPRPREGLETFFDLVRTPVKRIVEETSNLDDVDEENPTRRTIWWTLNSVDHRRMG